MNTDEYNQRVDEVIQDFRKISKSDYEVIWLLSDFMHRNYENGEDDIAIIYHEAITKVCKEHINKGE